MGWYSWMLCVDEVLGAFEVTLLLGRLEENNEMIIFLIAFVLLR